MSCDSHVICSKLGLQPTFLSLHPVNLVFDLNADLALIEVIDKRMLWTVGACHLSGAPRDQHLSTFLFRTPTSLTSSSWSEVGRRWWSFRRHCSRKSTNRWFHFFGLLSFGGGLRGIRNRALIGCMVHKAVGVEWGGWGRGTRGGAGGVRVCGYSECGQKLTGLSVCNLDGRDTKRPLVTLLGHYVGEGRGEEGRGGEGKVINASSSEPIPTAYPVVICGRRVLVTRYHLGSHPGVEKDYTRAQQVGWREGGGAVPTSRVSQ